MNNRFADFIYRGFWTALDWIYPPVCAGCGEPGYRLCLNCHQKIQFITGKRCNICGLWIKGAAATCVSCQTASPPYTAMRSLAIYEGVIRECVHALKYENNQGLGEYFSGLLVEVVQREEWQIELVMPVPLSPKRQIERGYNQSALIARPLALRLNLRYNPFGIQRTRETPSQVGLSAEDRRGNVAGAFKAVPEIVGGKRVLLIDDVMTTGSTMESCSNALAAAGTSAVFCLTLARFSMRFPIFNSIRHQV